MNRLRQRKIKRAILGADTPQQTYGVPSPYMSYLSVPAGQQQTYGPAPYTPPSSTPTPIPAGQTQTYVAPYVAPKPAPPAPVYGPESPSDLAAKASAGKTLSADELRAAKEWKESEARGFKPIASATTSTSAPSVAPAFVSSFTPVASPAYPTWMVVALGAVGVLFLGAVAIRLTRRT